MNIINSVNYIDFINSLKFFIDYSLILKLFSVLFIIEFYFLIFPFLLAQLDASVGSVVVIYKLNRFVEFCLSQLKRSFCQNSQQTSNQTKQKIVKRESVISKN